MYARKIIVLHRGKKKLLGDFLEIYTRSKDWGSLKGCLLELKASWKQNCISKSYRHVNENSVTQQTESMNKHYSSKWGLGPSEEDAAASSSILCYPTTLRGKTISVSFEPKLTVLAITGQPKFSIIGLLRVRTQSLAKLHVSICIKKKKLSMQAHGKMAF